MYAAMRFAGKTLFVFLLAQRNSAQRMCERPTILIPQTLNQPYN